MSNKGKLIVIDGTDGSGKGTQVVLLIAALQKEGRPVALVDFPQYSQPSAWFVEQYLNGKFGSLDEIGPYKASIFYAVDRYAASKQIQGYLDQGKIVVSNRYVTANMGHQGAKIQNKEKRLKYFRWLDNLEYDIMGIPRPDLNIILHVPAEIAQKLVDKKPPRRYLAGVKRDLHESNLKHLQSAEKVYLEIASEFDNFKLIQCTKNGELMSRDEIHKLVRASININ